jgi:hypothetical protein
MSLGENAAISNHSMGKKKNDVSVQLIHRGGGEQRKPTQGTAGAR